MAKIGQFFIIIGLIPALVFFATYQANQSTFGYLCFGIGMVFLGGYLIWRYRKPAEANLERFRTVRKILERRNKGKDDQLKKQE
jgi:Na+/phosphate symporter